MTLTRQDLLLLLLYAPTPESASIEGRTRLAKIMFIFNKEAWEEFGFEDVLPRGELPEFSPWRFGPFSEALGDSLEGSRQPRSCRAVDVDPAVSTEQASRKAHEFGPHRVASVAPVRL